VEGHASGVETAVVAIAHSRRASAKALAALLAACGYRVAARPVERSLIERIRQIDPDVVVVDGSIYDFDLIRLCRDLRGSLTATIVVVAPPGAGDAWTMEALHAGADDVLSSDASEAMIRTRMMVIVRNRAVRDREPARLVIGDVVVDLDGHAVIIDGDAVSLPMRLYSTLVELARRPNAVVTSAELLHEIWGLDPRPSHRRRLRMAVSSLRRLLGHGAQRPRIETIVRVGYRLVTATPTVATT
jgi:DNA-binding response OmpR family regulator